MFSFPCEHDKSAPTPLSWLEPGIRKDAFLLYVL